MLGNYTLWQGMDHLLHIYARFGVEDYKRYYFSDIQAIVTRKTAVGFVQNLVLGLFLCLFLWLAITFGEGWSVFFGIIAALMLISLVINVLRGPTCETHLMTAVQTEKLHSLHRLKNTSKIMNRLRPLIEQVQGSLSSADLDRMPAGQIDPTSRSPARQPIKPSHTAVKHEKGHAHMILFGLLLVDGLLVALKFFFSHVSLTVSGSVASICMGIFVIVALVKQHDSDMIRSLRILTWVTLGFVGISFAAGYIVSMTLALKHPGVMYNQWELLKSISDLSPWESPFMLGMDIFVLCGALFLGFPGLFMLKKFHNPAKTSNAARAVSSRRAVVSKNYIPG